MIFGSVLVGFNIVISNGQIIESNPIIFGLWRFSRGIFWDLMGDSGSQTYKIKNRLQVLNH